MATNRLYRDKEHAMLGGVCAGIANRLDLDPTIVRIVTIALGVVTAGTTVLIYLALWVIMPAGEAPERPSRSALTEEFREASDRVQETAKIVTRAARQAADEISQVQGRRREAAPPPAPEASTFAAASTGSQETEPPNESPPTESAPPESPLTGPSAPEPPPSAAPAKATWPPPAPPPPPSQPPPPPAPPVGEVGDEQRRQQEQEQQ